MVNSTDVYEKLGLVAGNIKELQNDIKEIRNELKDENGDSKLTMLQTCMKNHLRHHDRLWKIIIVIISGAFIISAALIGLL